jgi:3-oxoadipate enol-lactonase
MIRGAIGDTGIAYRVDGASDGVPIVFINSLGTDHRLWNRQVPAIQHDCRVIRYESCGHGVSDVPDGRMTIDRFGEQCLELLDHLGVSRAVICGCSLGGLVALWLAAHHPERVTGAVLANTGAKLGTNESWDTRIAAVRAGGMAAIRDAVLGRFLTAPFREREPDAARLIGSMLDATNPAGYIAACQALREADLRPKLGSVRVPTLVIGSDRDESTPLALSQELHANIVDSELVTIRDAAHLSNVEQADAFNDALVRRLREWS